MDDVPAAADRVLTLTRRFRAPRARVFRAFTDPAELARWWGPRGYRCGAIALDARQGGAYRIEMIAGDGEVSVLAGVYREVRAPERLVYTWIWEQGGMGGFESVVALDFVAHGEETELRLRHDLFPAATARDGHGKGWTACLECLDARLFAELDPRGKPVVFGVAPSTFTRTVRMALVEKGLEHALEPASPNSPEQDARHPFGRIPAFAHGELRLFESLAICRYVDEALPGPKLQPADPVERARMTQWIGVATDSLDRHFSRPIAFERIAAPRFLGRPSDEAKIAEALPRALAGFAAIDRTLAASPYLAGDLSTLADFYVFPIVDYAAMVPETSGTVAALPKLADWLARMRRRPSAVATVPF